MGLPLPIVPPLFFLAAVAYASAGFGGGSSYLAILALAGIPAATAAELALLCNLVVVSRGTLVLWRAGQLRLRDVLPFVAGSVPTAFIGARLAVGEAGLRSLLAAVLVAAGLVMMAPSVAVLPEDVREFAPRRRAIIALGLGAPLGLLAGLVGIGGGIFLAPLLTALRWETSRRIAALASAFILVNSVSALVGRGVSGLLAISSPWLFSLPLMVLLGGALGTYFLARRLEHRTVTVVTGAIVLFAGLRLLLRA